MTGDAGTCQQGGVGGGGQRGRGRGGWGGQVEECTALPWCHHSADTCIPVNGGRLLVIPVPGSENMLSGAGEANNNKYAHCQPGTALNTNL